MYFCILIVLNVLLLLTVALLLKQKSKSGFDTYNDNTLKDPTVSGNTTIRGDLTITGNIKCGNKITLGNGAQEWNMESALWGNGLSFWNTTGGKHNGHGKVLMNTDGNIWSAAAKEHWMSTIKDQVDNAQAGVNQLDYLKNNFKDVITGRFVWERQFNFPRHMKGGLNYGIICTVDTINRIDGGHEATIFVSWINNNAVYLKGMYKGWGRNGDPYKIYHDSAIFYIAYAY